MRRSSPALFELINGGTVGRRQAPAPAPATARSPDAAPIQVEAPEPEPADEAEPLAPPLEAPADDEADGERPLLIDFQRRFPISLSVMLLAGAGVVALCVLAWSTAYEVGKSEAREEAARELRRQSGTPVLDPLNSDLPLNPGLVQQKPAPAAASGAAPTAPGAAPAKADPREVGRNYLQLVTTDRKEAEGIVRFLGENGVGAFTVPVDRSGSSANNASRFSVFAARGITPEEYRARAAARTELDTAISRLGRRWKTERKGSTDFSGAFWSKFTG